MEEAAKRRLEAAGIDVDDALGRFLQNEALMMKFLGRFPADTSFSRLQEAMERGDAAQAFEAAHTLKGVAGSRRGGRPHGRGGAVVPPGGGGSRRAVLTQKKNRIRILWAKPPKGGDAKL